MTHLECVRVCMVTFFSSRRTCRCERRYRRRRQQTVNKLGLREAIETLWQLTWISASFLCRWRLCLNRQCLSDTMQRRFHLCSRSWKVDKKKKKENILILSNTWSGVTITFDCFTDNLHKDPRRILPPPFYPFSSHPIPPLLFQAH